MSKPIDMNSAVDFVRHNPGGLSVIRSLENSCQIITALDQSGMSGADLLERMRGSRFAAKLILMFSSSLVPEKALSLAMRVWELRFDENFRDQLGREGIKDVLASPPVYEHLLETVPIEDLAMLFENAPEDYWGGRIRYFIANGDLERAWDEVLKAHGGHYKARPSERLILSLAKEICAAVSREALDLAPVRAVVYKSKIDSLMEDVNFALSAEQGRRGPIDEKVVGPLRLLNNYFGNKKAQRRREQRQSRLRKYKNERA